MNLNTVVAWVLTYSVHSTIALAGMWIVSGFLRDRNLALEEAGWKAVLCLTLVTTTLQLGLAGVVEFRPLAGAFELGGPVEVVASDSAHSKRAFDPVSRKEVSSQEAVSRGFVPEFTSVQFEQLGRSEDRARGGLAATPGPRPWRLDLPWHKTVVSLLLFWLAATSILVLRLIAGYLLLLNRLRERQVLVSGPFVALLDGLRQGSGVSRSVELSICTELSVPLALGLRRWEICLPKKLSQEFDPSEQETVLAHELAHLVRRDTLWLLVGRTLAGVFFFQPLHLVALRRLRVISEMRCDDWAVAHTGRPVTLARCLTKVASWRSTSWASLPVPAMAGSSRSHLGNRVRRLLARNYPRPSARVPVWCRAAMVPLVLLFVAAAPAVVGDSPRSPDTTPVSPLSDVSPPSTAFAPPGPAAPPSPEAPGTEPVAPAVPDRERVSEDHSAPLAPFAPAAAAPTLAPLAIQSAKAPRVPLAPLAPNVAEAPLAPKAAITEMVPQASLAPLAPIAPIAPLAPKAGTPLAPGTPRAQSPPKAAPSFPSPQRLAPAPPPDAESRDSVTSPPTSISGSAVPLATARYAVMHSSGAFVGTDDAPSVADPTESNAKSKSKTDAKSKAKSKAESKAAEHSDSDSDSALDELEAFEDALDAELDALEDEFDSRFEVVEDEIDDQMDALESQLEDQFEDFLDAFEDGLETDVEAVEDRMEILAEQYASQAEREGSSERLRAVQLKEAELQRFERQRERELDDMTRGFERLTEEIWAEGYERQIEQAIEARERALEERMDAASRRIEVEVGRLEAAGTSAERDRLYDQIVEEMRLAMPSAEEIEEIRVSISRIQAELAPKMHEFERVQAEFQRELEAWRSRYSVDLERLVGQSLGSATPLD